ncbi:UNVERIFIED_CONTAM: hypothetical protein HDU68_000146 [Siphonaria sp. JEL0065]|nr:hypothetical protein HDU68_000146 [Siphonaria sp. JEL0065]
MAEAKKLSNRALKRAKNKNKDHLKPSFEQVPTSIEITPELDCQNGLIGIVGGGLAGFALALALQRKGIKSIVFEKDQSFEERAQGYGLTIQQAGRAMKVLGLTDIVLHAGVASSSHFIFDNNGRVILFWGTSSASGADTWDPSRNCHVARQVLRKSLLDALNPSLVQVIWGFQLDSTNQVNDKVIVSGTSSKEIPLTFEFDALAACDGIRSTIRTTVLATETANDFRYLNSFVMLGIFDNKPFPVLHDRMIQMSDGKARMFVMPFDESRSMWQLSFGMRKEQDAIQLSKSGSCRLKGEALKQCESFKGPILDLIECTDIGLITGYPVYDRDPLTLRIGYNPAFDRVTLLGDAAHPMSPFKGQGANQALIDAVDLADCIASSPLKDLPTALRVYEAKMIPRTTPKVLASRESIDLLHCDKFKDIRYQLERRGFGQQDEFAVLMETLQREGVGIWSDGNELNNACDRYAVIHGHSKPE